MTKKCRWQDVPGVDNLEWCKIHLHVRDKTAESAPEGDSKPWRDIVDVISKFVHLRPHKRYLAGKCPFHNDDGFAFEVIRGKQQYRCIFCESKGNALDFIQQYLNLPTDKALEYIEQ